MGLLDLGMNERGCANHGTFKQGCWACASVAENDHQRKLNEASAKRREAERSSAETQARIRRNGQIAQQRKRERRSFAVGVAFDAGTAVAGAIARKNAEMKAELARMRRPDSPAGWLPDPLDDTRLRWWDGQAWHRQTTLPPQQPQPSVYPAAWYPDYEDPSRLRYYDGAAWTPHTHPAD